MATIDSLIADVQTWSNSPATVVTTAVAAECVNATMRRMARRHSYTFMQMTTDLPLAGGTQNSVALPANFLEEIAVYGKNPGQSDPGEALTPIRRTLRSFWFSAINPLANVDPEWPQVMALTNRSWVTDQTFYYLWQNQLTIVPTPSQPITITLDYIQTSDLLAGLTPAAQNGFTVLYPDAVRQGALAECYRFLHDWTVAGGYEQQFAAELERTIVHDNAQRSSGGSSHRGI